jgi:hypothetical protein
LIPTVVGREKEFNKIMSTILKFCNTGLWQTLEVEAAVFIACFSQDKVIEIMAGKDNKELSIGEKREMLYKEATGIYSWMIDDDDDIAPNAIEQILAAIKMNPTFGKPYPSCITFREKCMMNGEYKSSNHSIKYEKWQDNFDGFDYVRCPFYKDVIRTDIAKSVPFPHIRYNEDEQWSKAIKPFLLDEVHIDEELYYYIYEPKDTHEERYGISS